MPAWDNLNLTDVLTGLWWVVVAILGGIGVRGGIRRSSAAGSAPASIEVMGDVVVVKKLDALIEAMDMNTVALQQKGLAIQKNTAALDAYTEALMQARRSLDRNTETAQEVKDEAERLSRDMRELGDRMARNRG